MNILAIDTTTKKASVALKVQDKIIIKEIDNEITHSEKLLPLLDSVLKEANLMLKDIDLFVCVQGPGSFTGLRIGIATIKALAKVTQKPIYHITSLELLALDGINKAANKTSYVLSLMDAKNSRAYYNLYRYTNARLISTEFKGNDYVANIIDSVIKEITEDLLIIIDNASLDIPNATIATLDLQNVLNTELDDSLCDYLTLDAMYYRKSEAERTKEGE